MIVADGGGIIASLAKGRWQSHSGVSPPAPLRTEILCKVIAVWNGTASGTKNTVDYAKRQGVRVINVLQKSTGSCFLINFCAEHMASEGRPAEQIRSYLSDTLPKLNYWKDR